MAAADAIIDGPHALAPVRLDILGSTAAECCAVARLPDVYARAPRGQRWPVDCSWLDALIDFDFDGRAVMVQYLPLLPLACDMWEQLGGGTELTHATVEAAHAERAARRHTDGLSPELPASYEWHRALVTLAALPSIPDGRVRFAQYATLVIQRCVCDSYHRDKGEVSRSAWAPICGWEAYRARGRSCDCLAILAENSERVFASDALLRRLERGTVRRSDHEAGAGAGADPYVRKLFSLGGLSANPNHHTEHLATLRVRGAKRGWSRFLLFLHQVLTARATAP